ncbi:fatty-acid-CoA ligase domain protein [Mycobacterium ulcerans str. Harvey]|uniref:Fatty-acid-CoA ligase domain protein n=1 Tax=Mycobacterium ulcerans str. Harvey TaxID=1299332 RepID=A0ABN0QR07_MYCUL|nr:fatty-acid-CoA ligase domain protein [Mycobacterium ulcerans str. Harvey]
MRPRRTSFAEAAQRTSRLASYLNKQGFGRTAHERHCSGGNAVRIGLR